MPVNRPILVLLVDDHREIAIPLARLIERQGACRVTSCFSFNDAMKQASRKQYDLLLTDYDLTDGNGATLLANIRQLYPIKGIVMSGYATEDDRTMLLSAGFDKFFAKPFTVEGACDAIGELCRTPNQAVRVDIQK